MSFLAACAASLLAAASARAVAPGESGPATAGPPQVASVDAGRFASAQAHFGLALLDRLRRDPTEPPNLVVSPGSAGMAFAYLDLGADPGMHAAIAKTLGFTAGEASAGLNQFRIIGKAVAALRPGKDPLVVGNAFFVDPALAIAPEVVRRFADEGMEARTARLTEAAGIDKVNKWVAEKTAGVIPALLDRPLSGAVLVAIDALHFKDEWADRFDAAASNRQTFHPVGGGTVDVTMMRLSHKAIAFRQDDRFIAALLPYKTPGYSLVVVTTKAMPAEVKDFVAAGDWLTGEGFTRSQGDLSLPKFGADLTTHLLEPLEALGLSAGMSPTAFNRLSSDRLEISDVIQKTVIRVDEAGTEAAAGTATVVSRGLSVDEGVRMIVDKPFVFALRDDKRNLVLLAGYVGKPPPPEIAAGPTAGLSPRQ